MRLHLIPDHGETYGQVMEQADLIAARLGVTDSSFEAHRVVLHLPDDLPPARKYAPAPAPAPFRPRAWHPMATCPRRTDGSLKDDVWLSYRVQPPLLRQVGSSRLRLEDDHERGRTGWLPGHIAEADLPLAPLPLMWQPMATCPRSLDGKGPDEHVWISYSNGIRPLVHVVGSAPEDDARFGRLGWLPRYVARADLPPPPEAIPDPESEPEPLAWEPMSTCPRTAAGYLTEDVWVAHSNGRPPIRLLGGSSWWLHPGDDERFGLVGWLFGHIFEADLPPAPEAIPDPESEPEPLAWEPMAMCPREANGRVTENVWVAYSDGRPPRLCRVGSSWLLPENDRPQLRIGWLPGHIPGTVLPPAPEAVPEPDPEPLAWRPMATCPREADGTLTEDVWISYPVGSSLRFRVGLSWLLRPEDDYTRGRLGWLPGHIDKADLPPKPKPASRVPRPDGRWPAITDRQPRSAT